MHTNFFQYGLSLSFFLSFLLSRCFSLSLTSDELWKLQRSFRSRNLTGYWAPPHQTDTTAHEVRPFANSCEVAFKVALLFEVIFAMQGHFFVVWRVRAVFFSYRAWPWKPRHGRKPLSLEARSTFARHWTAGRTKALSILPSLKKKRAKGVSWASGPLKRGQEHFSCPLLTVREIPLDLGTVTRPPSNIYARLNCSVIRDRCTRVQGHPRNLFRPPWIFGLFLDKAPHLTIPRQRTLVYGGKLFFSNAAARIPKAISQKQHDGFSFLKRWKFR